MEKARESTDAANLRSANAEVMTAALNQSADGISGITVGTGTYSKDVEAKQTQPQWQNTSIEDIGGMSVGNGTGDIAAKTSGSSWTITYTESTGTCTIN